MELSQEQLSHLNMFGPETYSIKLGPIGKELEELGLVEWVPSWMPGGHDYKLTDYGKEYARKANRK